MIQDAIKKLVLGIDLSVEEAEGAMMDIMSGDVTDAQIGSFLTGLSMKGASVDEITGCAKVMRKKASRIYPRVKYSVDTCGTGGSGIHAFNISTAAAFVAAAGGVCIAKHGNRAATSKSGSADVLEALGVKVDLEPKKVEACIEEIGMGFMFARVFHKSMKFAAGPRKELGIRTIFNILGPLTNPANANAQIMGVFDEKLTEPIANVLKNLGIERALVVHGLDGMDEISTTSKTKVSEVKDGSVNTYFIDPEELGFKKANLEDLKGGDSLKNAGIIEGIFFGNKGPKRDIVVINAAAALYVGKIAKTIKDGIKIAEEIIDSGKAMVKVKELAAFTHLIVRFQKPITDNQKPITGNQQPITGNQQPITGNQQPMTRT